MREQFLVEFVVLVGAVGGSVRIDEIVGNTQLLLFVFEFAGVDARADDFRFAEERV